MVTLLREQIVVLVALFRARDLRQAPVDDPDLTVAADHHVLGLQVAVDDPLGVGETHGLADGVERVDHPPQRPAGAHATEGPTSATMVEPADDLVEVLAADLGHGDEPLTVGEPPEVVDRHDRRVLELGDDLGLVDEAADHLLVVGIDRPQRLHSDQSVQRAVEDLAHLAGPADPEQPELSIAFHRQAETVLGRGLVAVLDRDRSLRLLTRLHGPLAIETREERRLVEVDLLHFVGTAVLVRHERKHSPAPAC